MDINISRATKTLDYNGYVSKCVIEYKEIMHKKIRLRETDRYENDYNELVLVVVVIVVDVVVIVVVVDVVVVVVE